MNDRVKEILENIKKMGLSELQEYKRRLWLSTSKDKTKLIDACDERESMLSKNSPMIEYSDFDDIN